MAGLGISINEQLAGEFSKLIEDSGYTKYRAVEAALRAFMGIPPEAQVALISNDVDAKELLTRTFRDVGISEYLEGLSPERRSQILLLAQQAAKKLSRKK